MLRNAWKWLSILGAAALCAGVADRSVLGQSPAVDLSTQAVAVLRQYCYNCHGREFKVEGYDVLDPKSLFAKRDDADPYITPKSPEKSELWNRFDEMPPKGPKPTAADKEVIRSWILSGATFPESEQGRPFIADVEVLQAQRDHLRKLDRADRPFTRFFTLTTLHNNPKITADELSLARAGIAKLINSLSRKPELLIPAMLGPSDTLLAVDIRRLGWSQERVWSRILAEYPYGLKYKNAKDASLREVAREIEELVGDGAGLADIRADWFLDFGPRPSLYHAILRIPKNVKELEDAFEVDIEADFLSNSLHRAGFTKSGVSKQMRLVDRHQGLQDYYWKSYDFRRTDAAVNLFKFPLGPAFPKNPFPDEAFTHAGGEIIFSLPNHLQGYMLVDHKGNRIDEGPPDIVFDANDSAGGSTIINGLSCMGCHKEGIIPFVDRIREGVAVSDAARVKVEALFPKETEWERLLKQDRNRFVAALEQATRRFHPKQDASIREPVIPIAKIHQASLDAGSVAAELNVNGVEELRALIRANRRLQDLGLADLLKDGGAINRADWASVGKGTSTYQQASSEIDRGLPALFFRSED